MGLCCRWGTIFESESEVGMIDVIKRILDKNNEISDYEIIQTKTSSSQLFYVLDKLETNRVTKNVDTNVIIYHDHDEYRGSSSFIVNASDDENSISLKIDSAIAIAKKINNPKFVLADKTDDKLVTFDSISDANYNDACVKIADAIFSAKHDENGWINSVEIFVTNIEKHFVNSNGVDHTFNKSYLEVEIIPTYSNNNEEIELYLDFKMLELDYDLITKKVEDVLKQAKLRSNAVNIEDYMKHCPVVIQDEMLAMIMENFATDISYQSVFNKANHYQINDKICDYDLNITVGPYAKNAVYSYPFDNHGLVIKEVDIIKNGIVCANYGDFIYGQYLKKDKINGNASIIKVDTTNRCKITYPYLEICNFSSPQLEEATGYFGGEIRLAIYHDKDGNMIPVTNFSISGNIYHDIKEARFADSDVTLDYYKGPKYIIFDHMSVN